MACSHLLSQGHITLNSEPWDTWTIGDHLGKKGKEKNKVSGKRKNKNRRHPNTMGICSTAVKARSTASRQLYQGSLGWPLLHPLACAPEEPGLFFRVLWEDPKRAKTTKSGKDSKASGGEMLNVCKNPSQMPEPRNRSLYSRLWSNTLVLELCSLS